MVLDLPTRRDGRLGRPRCLITRGPGVEAMTARSEVRRPTVAPPRQPISQRQISFVSSTTSPPWSMSSSQLAVGPVQTSPVAFVRDLVVEKSQVPRPRLFWIRKRNYLYCNHIEFVTTPLVSRRKQKQLQKTLKCAYGRKLQLRYAQVM